jgi:hypothetical protein
VVRIEGCGEKVQNGGEKIKTGGEKKLHHVAQALGLISPGRSLVPWSSKA